MTLTVVTEQISIDQALLAYFGLPHSSTPAESWDAVDEQHLSKSTRAAVTEILHDFYSLQPDWAPDALNGDMTAGGVWARAEMARRHPQLSRAALDGIAWAFTYIWR